MTALATSHQEGQQIRLDAELSMPPQRRWRWVWPLLLTILYVAVAMPFVWRHDVWRDEAQAFLLARDSASPWQLVLNARYEGHPLLWHMLLWGLTRVWAHPLGMQLLHLALAAGSVYLFARYAPVPILTKILFAFSYYAFFEYVMIARNYQLMLLLALTFCIVWQRRRSAFLWQSVILGLLANTNVFGALIALTLFSLMFWEMCFTRVGWQTWRARYCRCALAILLFAGLAASGVLTMHPPADSGFATSWYWDVAPDHIHRTAYAAWCGVVPVPPDRANFWNDNIMDGKNTARAIVYIYWVMGGAAALLLFSPRALFVYLTGSAAALMFLHVKYIGSVRHQGALFVILLVAAWIALAPRARLPGYFGQLFRGLLQLALIGLLAVHVWAGVVAVKNLGNMNFTNGRLAAECLKKNMTPGEPLIANLDSVTASIAAYLPGERIYYTRGDRWGTYTIWDQAGTKKSAFRVAREMAEEQKRSVIVVAHGGRTGGPRDAEKLGAFDGSFVDENYAVYRIRPRPAASAPATRAATAPVAASQPASASAPGPSH